MKGGGTGDVARRGRAAGRETLTSELPWTGWSLLLAETSGRAAGGVGGVGGGGVEGTRDVIPRPKEGLRPLGEVSRLRPLERVKGPVAVGDVGDGTPRPRLGVTDIVSCRLLPAQVTTGEDTIAS
jgi:hypothetical protein